jgi:hypothetical protein
MEEDFEERRPGQAVRTVRQERRHGPSITTQISPGWVPLLQPARRASVLGHLSSIRPHWTGHYSKPADRQNLPRFTARLYAGPPNKISNKSAYHISPAESYYLQTYTRIPASSCCMFAYVTSFPKKTFLTAFFHRLLHTSLTEYLNTAEIYWEKEGKRNNLKLSRLENTSNNMVNKVQLKRT